MTTEIDLCNLALAYLGEEANVSSIDPPEGSVSAEACARFYPMARDTLLASHQWGFATVTGRLALLRATYGDWVYAYACPANILSLIALTSNGARVEEYAREADGDGQEVILCNQPDIVARYTARVLDSSLFPPVFVQALAWQLASLLAGPIIKGSSGAEQAKRCAMLAASALEKAATIDARQTRRTRTRPPAWLTARMGDGQR